jgi:hypothetical protein
MITLCCNFLVSFEKYGCPKYTLIFKAVWTYRQGNLSRYVFRLCFSAIKEETCTDSYYTNFTEYACVTDQAGQPINMSDTSRIQHHSLSVASFKVRRKVAAHTNCRSWRRRERGVLTTRTRVHSRTQIRIEMCCWCSREVYSNARPDKAVPQYERGDGQCSQVRRLAALKIH